MQVRDVLRAKDRRVISIEAGRSVSEAIARLVENNIGSLPVVDGEGRVVGIFTERDLLRGVHKHGEGFCRTPIADVMTREPITCNQEEQVHDAMGKMSDHQIGQLPVLADGELIGLVSVGDVVRVLHETAEAENRHLLNYIYGAV